MNSDTDAKFTRITLFNMRNEITVTTVVGLSARCVGLLSNRERSVRDSLTLQ